LLQVTQATPEQPLAQVVHVVPVALALHNWDGSHRLYVAQLLPACMVPLQADELPVQYWFM
jgi:hypothetical protein